MQKKSLAGGKKVAKKPTNKGAKRVKTSEVQAKQVSSMKHLGWVEI
jgi:hypothetical protein